MGLIAPRFLRRADQGQEPPAPAPLRLAPKRNDPPADRQGKDDSGRWQYVALLKGPQVDTPLKAVQAYAVTQPKKGFRFGA